MTSARLVLRTAALILGLTAVAVGAAETIDLAAGAEDVRILGEEASGNLGYSVATGDVNGDGIDDILLGAPGAGSGTGKVYVIYGTATAPASPIDLAGGGADIVITGAAIGDQLGLRVASGDVSGDGIDDIIVAAPLFDPQPSTPNSRIDNGRVYVLYGGPALAATYDLGTATVDARITGTGGADGNNLGASLAVGDVDGDGVEDLLVGSPRARGGSTEATDDAGRVYWFRGGALPATFDRNAGAAPYEIWGAQFADLYGSDLAAGDVNGDGHADIIASALNASPDGRTAAGSVYVVYGSAAPTGVRKLLSTPAPVYIKGAADYDGTGQSVAAGDLNHDGVDDIVIGAANASPGTPQRFGAGKAYILFGGALASTIDLLTATVSVEILGADASAALGWSASVLNFNGDGFDDLLLGIPAASGAAGIGVGQAVVLVGDPQLPSTIDLATHTPDVTILGDDENDLAGFAVGGGDLNGDHIADLVIAAPTADPAGADAGEIYAVYGTPPYLELSAPDTTATYDQALPLAVRLDTTNGFRMVELEIDLLFDADLLAYQGLLQTGSLIDGWTASDTVVAGAGADPDTLRIAAATGGAAVTVTGDLLGVDFAVRDVRHPASSPLSLDRVHFNGTRPEWTPVTDGSVLLVGNDGHAEATVVVEPGDTVRVRAVDLDRNLDAAVQDQFTVAVASVLTGETEHLVLTELSVDDSVFFGGVPTVPGAGPGADDDGALVLGEGDSLMVSFVDSLDAAGGQVDQVDTVYALLPLGDVDANGSTQAFDAGRILAHAVGLLTLTGRDSLTANLDLQAPFGAINAFDATLVIQRRLGKLGRFPVQTPEAANHPQPAAPAAKPAAPRRALALRVAADGALVIVSDERDGIVAGDLVVEGVGRVDDVRPAAELGDAHVVYRQTGPDLRIAWAAGTAARGPGELLRLLPPADAAVRLSRVRLRGRLNGDVDITQPAFLGEASGLPERFELLPNHPNPFNAETRLRFRLPGAGAVRLTVHNGLGQAVRTLLSGALPAGAHEITWDGTDDAGRSLASGAYLVVLEMPGARRVRPVLLLK